MAVSACWVTSSVAKYCSVPTSSRINSWLYTLSLISLLRYPHPHRLGGLVDVLWRHLEHAAGRVVGRRHVFEQGEKHLVDRDAGQLVGIQLGDDRVGHVVAHHDHPVQPLVVGDD